MGRLEGLGSIDDGHCDKVFSACNMESVELEFGKQMGRFLGLFWVNWNHSLDCSFDGIG